jgi:hypothetical protein
MKFNDTSPVLPTPDGPPPWLDKLADSATLEAPVMKRPIEGKANILALLKLAIPLYEFQHFSYRGAIGSGLFLESYRAAVRGVPIETLVVVHSDAAGQVDSILINHRPLEAALLFSRLMSERVGDRFGSDLFLGAEQAAALEQVAADLRAR